MILIDCRCSIFCRWNSQKFHKNSLVYQIISLVANDEWSWILEFVERRAYSFRNILIHYNNTLICDLTQEWWYQCIIKDSSTSCNNDTWAQCVELKLRWQFCMHVSYSIVKDSSADLGVNFKIVQNRPTVKAVCTKISKFFFLHICQYFYISERK